MQKERRSLYDFICCKGNQKLLKRDRIMNQKYLQCKPGNGISRRPRLICGCFASSRHSLLVLLRLQNLWKLEIWDCNFDGLLFDENFIVTLTVGDEVPPRFDAWWRNSKDLCSVDIGLQRWIGVLPNPWSLDSWPREPLLQPDQTWHDYQPNHNNWQ